MPDLFAVVSRKPILLDQKLHDMLAHSSIDRASLAGWIGDEHFRGTLEDPEIPTKPATQAAALVGEDPSEMNVLLDPFSLRADVLECSKNSMRLATQGGGSGAPLFGSCLLRSGEDLVAARDPLGTRPLFLAEGDPTGISSLPLALSDYRGGGKALPTSTRLIMGRNPFSTSLGRLRPRAEPSTGRATEIFVDSLRSALQTVPSPRALFFSGGIDSMLLASMLDSMGPTTLICSGIEGCKDIQRAREAAEYLSNELELVEIPVHGIGNDVAKIRRSCAEDSPINIAVALPILHAARRANELGITAGLAGFGADELFGGYQRYLTDRDPEGSMIGDLYRLHERGMNACDLACRTQGVRLFLPYLEEDIVHLALSLPIRAKVGEGSRKLFLRKVGEELGIRREDALAPKRAIQYGSGVSKYVIRILKERGA